MIGDRVHAFEVCAVGFPQLSVFPRTQIAPGLLTVTERVLFKCIVLPSFIDHLATNIIFCLQIFYRHGQCVITIAHNTHT